MSTVPPVANAHFTRAGSGPAGAAGALAGSDMRLGREAIRSSCRAGKRLSLGTAPGESRVMRTVAVLDARDPRATSRHDAWGRAAMRARCSPEHGDPATRAQGCGRVKSPKG